MNTPHVNIGDLLDALSFTVSRSSGPGGQNVNKVNTRVTLVLDLPRCTCFTAIQQQRILSRLRTRCDKLGQLRVVSQKHRTQGANRRAAEERLYELLEEAIKPPTLRKPTQPTRAARERRLEGKRQRGQVKRTRVPLARGNIDD